MNIIDQIKRDYPGADTRERNAKYAAILYYASAIFEAEPYRSFADLPDHKKGQWIGEAERALA